MPLSKKTQNIKQKQFCNKVFNKDFKNGSHQKKSSKENMRDHLIRRILNLIGVRSQAAVIGEEGMSRFYREGIGRASELLVVSVCICLYVEPTDAVCV